MANQAQVSDIETTTTSIAPEMGVMLKGFIALAVVLLVLVGGLGLVMYYIVSKINDSVTLTLVLCLMGLGVLLAATAVALGAFYFVRRMGGALTEQSAQNQREMAGALVHLVSETRESRRQTDRFINAMLGGQSNQPLQLTGSTRQPRNFALGGYEDADGDGRDDDDRVEVWTRNGSQWRKVESRFSLLDDFIRMPQPNRQLWKHGNSSYGQIASIVEGVDKSPLKRVGNSWEWTVPHDQVLQWWVKAQKANKQ